MLLMPKPWLALFCLKVAAWAWAEGLGRSYAGGRLGVAIWIYIVDGWEDRYLGRSFYIWVGGMWNRKRSRGWLDLVMGM